MNEEKLQRMVIHKYKFIVLISCTPFLCCAQLEAEKIDTLFHNQNGADSLRIVKQASGQIIRTSYYPNGRLKSELQLGKSQSKKRCSKYIEWDQEGHILEKTKTCRYRKLGSYKDVKWYYWENGKRCFRREVKGWTDKY